MAAAWEIARELSLAGAEDDSRRPSSVEGSPTPLPKFASYLARVRLGAVCLSVAVLVWCTRGSDRSSENVTF